MNLLMSALLGSYLAMARLATADFDIYRTITYVTTKGGGKLDHSTYG